MTIAAALLLFWVGGPGRAQQEPEPDEQLRRAQDEIRGLERELAALAAREVGILGELERLGAELRLREAELRRTTSAWTAVTRKIELHSQRLAELETIQSERRRYLTFRVREVYKHGAEQDIRRILGGDPVEDFLGGLRYAAYLNRRDGRVLAAYRADIVRLGAEREELLEVQQQLAESRRELEGARRRLEQARAGRERLLRRVREDQATRNAAVGELERAADELEGLIDSLEQNEPALLDIRKFRGLLEWPSDGEVSAGFGSVVHPRFKTRVPHPGLDIEGDTDSDIRAIFDGRVVFADWMRGYGLTAILDHGQGVLSVYAHASVLLVEPGDRLLRGARIGKIGDTGSLRGPYLYFELRLDGHPIDPRGWLRPAK